ncbi:MAG: HDOD domain-containing protein [Opitutae bacterium]|jgi:HD-like signal output (HDOD) protein|nr:HDOD domain-containing protein [Opitutae bacterium]
MNKKEVTYDEIIEGLGDKLPSLPQILDDLVKTLGNLNVTLDLIEEQIRIDQSISLEILKVVNKVEFLELEEKRITSIGEAIHKLGFENVQKIIMNVSVLPFFSGTKFPPFFKVESLWKHCVGVALGSHVISEFLEYGNNDRAYACGLVHDIGKVAKINFSANAFSKELLSAKRKKMTIHEMEVERNLLQHEILGSLIAEKWAMPYELCQSIRWHHTELREDRTDLEDPDIHLLVDIVLLANSIVNKMKFGTSGHSFYRPPSQKFLKTMGLNEANLVELEEAIRRDWETKFSYLAILK